MSKTVLIVDDEKEILDVLTMIFESLDYKCLTAENGEEALKKIKVKDIDLLILDNMMPQMSGEEVLETIHREKLKNFKIIFSSGQTMSLLQLVNEKEYFVNIDYLLNKPFNIDKIKEALEEID
ncbi:response regulator [Bacteriovorax sp. DB6_IX]|uniref:response regulator n=1 Tax=Bacteriovorax sp. DB6_IX TaxID=1353530 RepID=UPI00038A1E35|nr:response regulator [Bacteriovorax sp. DB6_IX]EQC52254.1 response regulator receiver domain protein [Bacteriovorax sp. DB6_IX]